MTPLSSSDSGWLHMEEPCNRMMIVALLEFGGHLDRERLIELLRVRLLVHERFGCRVDEGTLNRPAWVPCPVDFDYHLQIRELDKSGVLPAIGELVAEPLDRARPLWQMHLFRSPAGSSLVVRLHHAMGDGITLMKVMLSLTDELPVGETRTPGDRRIPLSLWIKLPGGLLRLLSLLVSRPDPPTALKGDLGRNKRAAVSGPLPLERLKSAAREQRLTLNDFIMDSLNESLRAYLLERGQAVHGLSLRAVVPIDLRRQGNFELGNHFGLVFLDLPVGQEPRSQRVSLVKRTMDRLKSSPEGEAVFALLRLVGLLPAWIEHWVVRIFGSKATLVATNLIGPRERCTITGVPLERIAYWVPTSGSLGLGVSFLSYAGSFQVAVASDAGLVPDPERLVQLFCENAGVQPGKETSFR